MTQYSEWKIHNGGECPVDGDVMVQVQYIDETRDCALTYNEPLTHQWQVVWSRVICYREVIKPKRKTVRMTGFNKCGWCFGDYGADEDTAEITFDTIDGKIDWSTVKGRDL